MHQEHKSLKYTEKKKTLPANKALFKSVRSGAVASSSDPKQVDDHSGKIKAASKGQEVDGRFVGIVRLFIGTLIMF